MKIKVDGTTGGTELEIMEQLGLADVGIGLDGHKILE